MYINNVIHLLMKC